MEDKNIKALEELEKTSDEKYIQMLKNNEITKILRAIGLFPDQTITNDILILSQRPDATCVKRMRDWNYYRRSVNKSEKSIKVISNYIEKFDQDYEEEDGKIFTKGISKLRTDIGYLFDISQTNGKEYNYLYSNKETVAQHFDAAKSALEKTAREYKFEFRDIDVVSIVDKDSKTITLKDGMELNEVVNRLIKEVTGILLETRQPEGLKAETKENIDEIELNSAIYAIHSKLGLDLPEYDFSEISKFSEEDMFKFKDNLNRVRSVSKQLLSNFERAIEKSVRNLEKAEEKVEEVKVEEKQQEEVKVEEPVAKPKRTRKKQTESEVEHA
ncbi:MAG: hypothetical protein IKA31_03375 [Clostridia bacterium]|nr:hypothetical protein [Clostridia bacterium]MBR2507645.1 hypothetical protein [Bacilli bacterium]MBR4003617.1 hypothetical protein [Clostridia bacterium]